MSAGATLLTPLELSALVMLRGEASDAGFGRCVRDHLGLDLPAETGLATAGNGWRMLCLGPDRWLVLSLSEACLVPVLRNALQEAHAAVLDMRDGLLAGRLEGPRAGEALARGCALDLHPRNLARDTVFQTRYRRAKLILLPDIDSAAFDLLVERSFAPYVWEHLRQDAALLS